MPIFKHLENIIYFVRDSLWQYPAVLFTDPNSYYKRFKRAYINTRPISHFLSVLIIFTLIGTMVISDAKAFLKINSTTLVEGVIVGVDDNGDLQKLNRVNPLINTNVQLEKDLNELIYESLVDVDLKGDVKPVLADYFEAEAGKVYQFKLKDNLYWQDGVKVTTDDVAKTFALVQSLDKDPQTSTIYSRAASKIDLKVIDDRSFQFKLNSVIPAFFEAISFKIMPAHLLNDVSALNITSADPLINRRPVGTGPYQLTTASDDSLELVRNDLYHGPLPSITHIRFKMFADEASAVEALTSGQIHSLTGISTDDIRNVSDVDSLQVIKSNVIYNQYWGLYFNMGDNGPAFFKDVNVRRAISSAIDRNFLIQSILGLAKEAKGPIPEDSFAYDDVATYGFDKQKAINLLDAAGWKLPSNGTVREKDGTKLSFAMVLVDNADRAKIAEVIRADLADVGVEVVIQRQNLDDVVNQHIIPRLYDTLLYGVQTFIDPDRYELFHSSQIAHPGLNVSSYTGSKKVLSVVGANKEARIPEVDDVLNDGRLLQSQAAREKKYQIFQEDIAQDVPVAFLYHPIETYIVNKRVKGVVLDDINSIEQRFRNISNWQISID